MKKILLIGALSGLLLASCTNKWDEHFDSNPDLPSSEDSKTIVMDDLTIKEFFAGQPEYSIFYEKLSAVVDSIPIKDSNNVYDYYSLEDLFSGDQGITIWAVSNTAMNAADPKNFESKPLQDVTMKYHVNNLAYSFNDLKDGTGIVSLAGKANAKVYLKVKRTDLSTVYLNYDDLTGTGTKVEKTYKLKNGYVHVIESMMVPLMSIYEYIELLPDEFSTIRDTIVKSTYKKFDRANSIQVGVNKMGMSVYDSAFVYDNPFFHVGKKESDADYQYANISLTNKMFTYLLPTNTAVAEALDEMKAAYDLQGDEFKQEDIVFFFKWLREAIIYSGTGMFTSEALQNIKDAKGNMDLKSLINNRLWRANIQKVKNDGVQDRILCNNGEMYYVTKLKLPNFELFAHQNEGPTKGASFTDERYPSASCSGYRWGRICDMEFLDASLRANKVLQERNGEPVTGVMSWSPTHTPSAAGTSWGSAIALSFGNLDNFADGTGRGFTWSFTTANYNGGGSDPTYYQYIAFPILRGFINESFENKAEIMYLPVGEYDLYLGGRNNTASSFEVFVNQNPTSGSNSHIWPNLMSNPDIKQVSPSMTMGSYFQPLGGNGTKRNPKICTNTFTVKPMKDGSGNDLPYGTIEIIMHTLGPSSASGNWRFQIAHWAVKASTNNY